MNEKLLKYLYDIKLAIDEIESFFAGKRNILLITLVIYFLNGQLKEIWKL
jgi:hypothetical protein